MILIYPYIFFTLMISVKAFHEKTLYDFHNLVYLVTDLQKLYSVPSIYIVHGETHTDFNVQNVLFHLSKQFSLKNIWSQGLSQSEFYKIYKRKISLNSRQLIVLILQNQNHLKEFENFTRINSLGSNVWLTLFWSEPNSTLSYFCKNPTSTRLRLNFDIRMLVKCLDDQTIQEWYAVSPYENVIASDLLDWSPENGITRKTRKTLFERRGDFKGAKVILKVSNVQENADVNLTEKNGYEKKVGVVEKIMTEIIKELNLSIKSYPPANAYGSYNESKGEWNGILGNLSRGDIDIAFAEFGISPLRLKSFDFTLPLFRVPNEIYIKKPERYMVKWNAYGKAFDSRIWISIFIIIFIGTVTISLIKINFKMSYWRKNNFFENYICVWGIYCQQSLPEFPDSSASRIANVSLFLSAIVITAAYSGSIVRNLTNLSPWLPFTSFEEFSNINSYKLVVTKDSLGFDHFIHTQDPLLLKMAKMMKPYDELPRSDVEGLQRICYEDVVFYTSQSVKNKYEKAVPCLIKGISEGRERYVAVALTKNHPLTAFINYQIRKFDDHGLIKRSKTMYKELTQYPAINYDPVGLWEVTPALMILILGIVVSLLALLFECISYSLTHSRINHRVIKENELQTQISRADANKHLFSLPNDF